MEPFKIALGITDKELSKFTGIGIEITGEDSDAVDHFGFYESINEKFSSSEELLQFLKSQSIEEIGSILESEDDPVEVTIEIVDLNVTHETASLGDYDQFWISQDFPFDKEQLESKSEDEIEFEMENSVEWEMTWDIENPLVLIVASENTEPLPIPFKS